MKIGEILKQMYFKIVYTDQWTVSICLYTLYV